VGGSGVGSREAACGVEHSSRSAVDASLPRSSHWDGKAWSVVAAPKPKKVTVLTQLNDVSCPSAKSRFAAGYYYTDGNIPPVIERWNGIGWAIAYNPGFRANLYGVSCASAASCVAVGAKIGRTIVERFA
jgi:hypothetical protein